MKGLIFDCDGVIVESDESEARPGVLRLMDEARQAGMKLGVVCSPTAGASSAGSLLSGLIGAGRFEGLDCLVAGSDVSGSETYVVAAERLGLQPSECVVVQENPQAVKAARAAGMRCIVTYTDASRDQSFPGAERIVRELGSFPAQVTVRELQEQRIVQDDRIEMTMTEGAVFWHIPGQ